LLIHVIRKDNHFDYVKDFMLDLLIASKTIVKFKRSSGWVTIGVDPIRMKKRAPVQDSFVSSPQNSRKGAHHES
jgi:hypothetical protein